MPGTMLQEHLGATFGAICARSAARSCRAAQQTPCNEKGGGINSGLCFCGVPAAQEQLPRKLRPAAQEEAKAPRPRPLPPPTRPA